MVASMSLPRFALCCAMLMSTAMAQRKVVTIGGTLSMDGALMDTMKEINQSYFMWKSRFEQDGIPMGSEQYDVAFYFENDHSCPDTIESVLSHMLNDSLPGCYEPETCIRTPGASNTPDFMLGPASSSLAREFARVTEMWKVITVHGSASVFAVFHGTSNNFGVLAKASHFSESLLRKLVIRDSQLDSIVVLRDALSASADACSPLEPIVKKLGQQLGRDIEVTELGASLWNQNNSCTGAPLSPPEQAQLAQLLKKIESVQPDVIMGCLEQATCEKLLSSCANSTFVPKALILPMCLSDSGYRERISQDAQFVLGASQWNPLSTEIGIEGMSAKSWVDWFKEVAVNEGHCDNSTGVVRDCNPSVTAAAHYASLLALEFAFKGVKDQACSEEVEALLARLDIKTFFGRIRFNSHGQNVAPVIVEQYDYFFNRQVVYPNKEATAPIIFPFPSLEHRECIDLHGMDSCHCKPKGCLPCGPPHWNETFSDCHFNITRTVEHEWKTETIHLECDMQRGKRLPRRRSHTCEFIPLGSDIGIGLVVVPVLAAICCMVILALVIYHREKPVIRMSQVDLSIVIIVGAILYILGTITLVGENTDLLCSLQLWFLNLPFAIMFGGILLRLNKVYLFTVGNKKLKRFELPWYDAWVKLFVIVAVPIIVLTIAQVTDPPQRVPFVTKRKHGYSCSMENSEFATILIMYRFFLILVGIYYCVRLRSVVNSLSDTKGILWATYNISVWTVIETVLQGYFTLLPYVQLIMISHVSESLLAVGLLYVPKLLNLKATEEELLYGTGSSQVQSSSDSAKNFQRAKEEVLVLKAENRKLRLRIQALEEEKSISPEDLELT